MIFHVRAIEKPRLLSSIQRWRPSLFQTLAWGVVHHLTWYFICENVWLVLINGKYNHLLTYFVSLSCFITGGMFWAFAIVVACVCVSVSLCVNHLLVGAQTRNPFKQRSQNLDQWCKTPRLRSLLFCGMIDLDHQGQISLKTANLPYCELVHTKTHQLFKLGSPNLD